MAEQRRVTFRFGPFIEVRYLDDLPEAGDRVTHEDELWTVAQVGVDGAGALVVCERPAGGTSRDRGFAETLA